MADVTGDIVVGTTTGHLFYTPSGDATNVARVRIHEAASDWDTYNFTAAGSLTVPPQSTLACGSLLGDFHVDLTFDDATLAINSSASNYRTGSLSGNGGTLVLVNDSDSSAHFPSPQGSTVGIDQFHMVNGVIRGQATNASPQAYTLHLRGLDAAADVDLTGLSFEGEVLIQLPLLVDLIGVTGPTIPAGGDRFLRFVAPKSGTDNTAFSAIIDGDWSNSTTVTTNLQLNSAQYTTARDVLLIGPADQFGAATTMTFGTNQDSSNATNKQLRRMFAWNPQFVDSTDGSSINDVRLRFGLGTGEAIFKPTATKTSALSTALSAAGWLTDDGNGYWYQTDVQAGINAVTPTTTISLTHGTGGVSKSVNVKSYTHVAPTSSVNTTHHVQNALHADGSGFTESAVRSWEADSNLNGRTRPVALGTALELSTADDMYPIAKAHWWDDDSITAAFIPSIVNGVFTTTQSLDLAASVSDYAAGELEYDVATGGFGPGNNVNGLSVGGGLNVFAIDRSVLWAGGITTTGALINLTGDNAGTAFEAASCSPTGDLSNTILHTTGTGATSINIADGRTLTNVTLSTDGTLNFVGDVTLINCTIPTGTTIAATGTISYDVDTYTNSFDGSDAGAGSLRQAITDGGGTPAISADPHTFVFDANGVVGNVQYVVRFSGATADLTGAIQDGGTATVVVPQADYGTQTATIVMTGANIISQYATGIAYDEGATTTQTAALNPLFANGTATSGLTADYDSDVFTINIPTGYTGLAGGEGTNTNILGLKSSTSYADFIADVGLDYDINSTAQNNIRLTYDITENAGVKLQITIGTGISDVQIQGANYRSAHDGTFALVNASNFNTATTGFQPVIVERLTVYYDPDGTVADGTQTTTASTTVGMQLVPDTSIDYLNVESSVNSALDSNEAISETHNALGWIAGGNASRIPVRNNYDGANDYTDNL